MGTPAATKVTPPAPPITLFPCLLAHIARTRTTRLIRQTCVYVWTASLLACVVWQPAGGLYALARLLAYGKEPL